MKRWLVLLALVSCTPSPPVFKPVSVEIPVAESCSVAPIAKPDFALNHIAATDNLFSKTQAALAEIDQRRGYEAELEARVAAGCP